MISRWLRLVSSRPPGLPAHQRRAANHAWKPTRRSLAAHFFWHCSISPSSPLAGDAVMIAAPLTRTADATHRGNARSLVVGPHVPGLSSMPLSRRSHASTKSPGGWASRRGLLLAPATVLRTREAATYRYRSYPSRSSMHVSHQLADIMSNLPEYSGVVSEAP
ncbi:hypothetical protein BDV95DRAFT_668337 [Massariosphaeria phaeospora]|uniref:Uncharacterized protein n=1 Tax=Massariosphaeria phaeospora TaxID=100035 RepID=A0A7C8IE04_9PLEO|nr:hypothetical protein BDV95DRAFT_668337 [Massariosphaeria phaeospora]